MARAAILSLCLLLLGIGLGATVAEDAKDAKEESVANDALRQELLRMMKEDQAARFKMLEWMKANGKVIAKGARNVDQLPELKKLQEIDKQNTERLKAILDKHGWPGKTLVGQDGAHAAWLMVQHADHDRPFQKRCLKLMEAAAKKDEVSKADIAYLVDRVLLAEGKKQRYGTQFKQEKDDWVPQPIEDEANVDKRRAEAGLQPLAEYKRLIKDAYQAKEQKAKEDKE